MEKQLRNNAEMIIIGYDLNREDGQKLTQKELLEYVQESVYDIKCNDCEQIGHGKGICDELRAISKKRTREIILEIGRKHQILK